MHHDRSRTMQSQSSFKVKRGGHLNEIFFSMENEMYYMEVVEKTPYLRGKVTCWFLHRAANWPILPPRMTVSEIVSREVHKVVCGESLERFSCYHPYLLNRILSEYLSWATYARVRLNSYIAVTTHHTAKTPPGDYEKLPQARGQRKREYRLTKMQHTFLSIYLNSSVFHLPNFHRLPPSSPVFPTRNPTTPMSVTIRLKSTTSLTQSLGQSRMRSLWRTLTYPRWYFSLKHVSKMSIFLFPIVSPISTPDFK